MKEPLKQSKRIGLAVMSVALVAALLLGSVVPAKAAEERVIKIGVHAGLTGPEASTGLGIAYAKFDYMREVNDQGGINGIPIKVIWYDDGINIGKTILAHRRMEEAGVLVEMFVTSNAWDILGPEYIKKGIPATYVGVLYRELAEDVLAGQEAWLLANGDGTTPEFAIFLDWVRQGWTEKRPIRVGLYVTEYRAAVSTAAGALDYLPTQKDVEFVGEERIPVMPVDTTIEQLRLADKNPDWIYMVQTGAGVATTIKDAARLGLPERGIGFATIYAGIDEMMIAIAGKDSEGMYAMKFHPLPVETALPGVTAAIERAKKYRGWGPEKVTSHYVMTTMQVMIVIEAIKLAIEKVGYENLNRRAVRDAIFSMKDFDTGMMPPISIADKQPWVSNKWRVTQVQYGRLVPVTDWIESKPAYYPEYYEKIGPA